MPLLGWFSVSASVSVEVEGIVTSSLMTSP